MRDFSITTRLTFVILAGATLVLAACGGGASPAATGTAVPTAPGTTTAPPLETVTLALDWVANVNYLGVYAAIGKGYLAARRIDLKVLPYANTPAEPLVESGKADLGISYPPDVIINRAAGLAYRAVAALVARNTTALAVLDSSPYTTPAQLDGRLYGGFGIPSDEAIVTAILKRAGVASPRFRQVVLTTGAIDALAAGRVQYSAVFAGIDDVQAELAGTRLRLFPYRDVLGAAGDYPNAVYVAADATIAKRADALRRTLAALAEGYEWAAANPEAAGRLLIDQNRTELSSSETLVARSAAATAPLFVDAAGRWGALQDADFAGLEQILADGGVVKGSAPPVGDLYTDSLLPPG
jgi:ABC-type nitrate/sulfonate/bicarbonate transport system substrate-binding protein